jgi:hypothetical protein
MVRIAMSDRSLPVEIEGERQHFPPGLSFGMALAILSLGLAIAITPAHAAAPKAPNDVLSAFSGAKVLTASELGKVRGGFDAGGGVFVQIGFEVSQFANNVLQNQVSVSPINIHGNSVTNTFTVTQTTAGGGTKITTLSQLPAGGLTALTNLNSNAQNVPQTVLSVTLNNGSIQSLIQNQANNQALSSITTVNIITQGLLNAIHNIGLIWQINQMVHQWR